MTSHRHETHHISPLEIFCSYTSEDELLFRHLEQRLAPLQRQGRLILRHRGQIPLGADVGATLSTWQTQASLILLLVSPAYLASDSCYQEAVQAMQGSAHVIPVILSPCNWSDAVFVGLRCLPRNQKPITSWPNQDEAWHEVIEDLRQALNELLPSGLSVPSTGPTIWNVPFARNPFFTGRDELLERLHAQLHTMQTAAVSQPYAVSGLGGVGKTHLVTEYAYCYASEYQAVLWARAETVETLNASYTEIAQVLDLPQKHAQEQEAVVQAVEGWLRSRSGWLLILDNADEPAVLTSFLPKKIGGQVLVTTRASTDLVGLGLGFGHALAVETFIDEVGALFLLHRSGLLAPSATLEQAEEEMQQRARAITQELGGLPLALDQAGAYLKNTQCDLAVYQQIYQQHRAQLLKERRSADHPESVATTWLISFEKVEQQNPAAADLLRLCAYLSPDAIPEEILMEGAKGLGERLSPVAADPFLLNGAIESLRAYSFISRDPQAQTLGTHRLVQAVVRDRILTQGQQLLWMLRAVIVVDSASRIELEDWLTGDRLIPHALVCVHWIEQLPDFPSVTTGWLNQVGAYLYSRARYAEAEPLFRRALALQEQQLGPDHSSTACYLSNLGALYQEQGKYSLAEPLLVRALSVREQQLEPDHSGTANTLNHLALLYHAQGKYEQAESVRSVRVKPWQHGGYATG